jgi:N-acetylneuraminic acid mutarotase
VNFSNKPFIFAIGSYIYVGGGGEICSGPFNAFYQYDPANNTWTQKANLLVPLFGAVGASDGTYGYIACGTTTNDALTNTLYQYDPIANSWTALSTVPGNVGRRSPFMAYYQGKLYIGGGYTPNCRQDFYAYDIATNTWTTLPNHPNTQWEGWAVAYNGKIYVTGEHSCSNCINQFYYYDIASNTWSPMSVFTGGNRNDLKLVELNGILYGGLGKDCPTTYYRDWWAFCP